MPINQNQALFSLYGTVYGGDGRTTFALPDLRGRSPVNAGQGPGLSSIPLGARGGAEATALTVQQMPSHSHSATGSMAVTTSPGNSPVPQGQVLATVTNAQPYGPLPSGTPPALADGAVSVTVGNAGGGQSVPLRDPYLAITYCVVLQGLFPSRN